MATKTNKPAALLCNRDGSNLDGYCPQYTYVENTLYNGSDGILDPLFDIANKYGFSNWTWHTHQGPSFPAHQFLLSGTSAAGSEGGTCPLVGNNYCAYPCYNHPTLVDILDNHNPQISWGYYSTSEGGLWTGPNAFQNICGPPHSESCNLQEWMTHVQPYFPVKDPPEFAPILRDIEHCNLPAVSWVVPEGHWSDHPGYDSVEHPGPHNGGPSYLASIVNAVGNSWAQSNGGGQCDYWGGHTTATDPKNQPTVILIIWDEWGGFYDHVSPDASKGGPGIGYPGSNSGGSQYVYGFRVPLLVVSAFAKPHFVDGPTSNPVCGPLGFSWSYCHDFGSILNFIEYAFGSGGASLGEIYGTYHYADYWAPDASPNCQNCTYSLSDFFGDFDQPQTFKPVFQGKYRKDCFHNPKLDGCFGTNFVEDDPDNDADDQ